ncbi:MAG: glycosyltransferase, partial [Acidimicrobiales bacterium]
MSRRSLRVVAVVPALNEADNIVTLVAELKTEVDVVVVVDNGSTDGTAARAAGADAEVVTEPRRGYGYACAAGSDLAIELGA